MSLFLRIFSVPSGHLTEAWPLITLLLLATSDGQDLDQTMQSAADQGERPRRPKQQPAPVHLEAGIVRGCLRQFLISALPIPIFLKVLKTEILLC